MPLVGGRRREANFTPARHRPTKSHRASSSSWADPDFPPRTIRTKTRPRPGRAFSPLQSALRPAAPQGRAKMPLVSGRRREANFTPARPKPTKSHRASPSSWADPDFPPRTIRTKARPHLERAFSPLQSALRPAAPQGRAKMPLVSGRRREADFTPARHRPTKSHRASSSSWADPRTTPRAEHLKPAGTPKSLPVFFRRPLDRRRRIRYTCPNGNPSNTLIRGAL
jgi:hypothetical protein